MAASQTRRLDAKAIARLKWWSAGWIGSCALFILSTAIADGWFGLPDPEPGWPRYLTALLPTVSSLAVLGIVLLPIVELKDEVMRLVWIRAKVAALTVTLAIMVVWTTFSRYAGIDLPSMWPFQVIGFFVWGVSAIQGYIWWKYR
jgi:hypothetical protein